MKIGAILGIILMFVGKSQPSDDCVKFTEDTPKFKDQELVLIGKFMPQMIELKPKTISGQYLSEIKKSDSGYVFIFSPMAALRTHKCLSSGDVTLAFDGGSQFTVNTISKTLYWYPEESFEKPIRVKLKSR